MSDAAFRRAVAVLATLRIVPALLVLAANGRSLPALPGYGFAPPSGDTYGYYAAARDFIAVWARVAKPLLAVGLVLAVAGAAGAWILWRRRRRDVAVALAAVTLGLVLSIGVQAMSATGAGAVGWPLVWSLPLFPLRAAGALGYHAAYYLGIALLLLCNVVTVVATALIARRLVPGRIALLAPSLLVAWPFLMRLVEGWGSDVQGSWLDDSGIALYTEPLSTALVATALALLILRTPEPAWAALAGALLGFSAVVRISNVTIVAVAFAGLLFATSRRNLVAFAVASAGLLAVAAAYWPHGYSTFDHHGDPRLDTPISWDYVVASWRDSNVFDWKMLLILLPLPLLGLWALRRNRYEAYLLAGTVVVTAAFYSAYSFTSLHPRFLFVALPPLFVLAAAGTQRLAVTVSAGRRRTSAAA